MKCPRSPFPVILLLAAPPVLGSPLERNVRERWQEAWVITRVETFSDCGDRPTLNRVTGEIVKSGGRQGFGPGELARVARVDGGGHSVQLDLDFPEPVLVSRRDGPFTLYDERTCRVRLQTELPLQAIRDPDSVRVEFVIEKLLQRFPSEAAARAADAWNRRRRDPYPRGYERTLIDHAVWMLEKVNQRARARFDRILQETSRIADRMNGDPDYTAGFVEGVKAARTARLGSCAEVLKFDLDETLHQAARNYRKRRKGRNPAARDGYRDGHLMVYGMRMLQRIPECFVPVSEAFAAPAGPQTTTASPPQR